MITRSKPFLYFGTPYVARDTLARLVARGYIPSLVITSPDARRGRGLTLTPSETKAWALENGIPVVTPERLDEAFMRSLDAYDAEYAIVVAYGKILPQSLIDRFPLGILNVHYSLLPKYRGASPVEGAILAGDTLTGVSIQQMAFELDSGNVLASAEVAIVPSETTRELRPRLVRIGAELLADILPAFEARTLLSAPQDHAAATFTKKIRKEEGCLSLANDPRKNWNRYRAYAESPGTYFFMERDGERIRVKIKSAAFENGAFVPVRVVPEGKNETAYDGLVSSGWTPG